MTAKINDLIFAKLESHLTHNLDRYARAVHTPSPSPSRPVLTYSPATSSSPSILSIIDNNIDQLTTIVINCKSCTVLSDTIVILFPNDEYEIYPFSISDYSTVEIF